MILQGKRARKECFSFKEYGNTNVLIGQKRNKLKENIGSIEFK
jgi:hypothetical protein